MAAETLGVLLEAGTTLRAKQLVEAVGPRTGVSRSLVFLVLDELVREGLISKYKRSHKVVLYDLTNEGRKFIEGELSKAVETVLAIAERTNQPEELALKILVRETLKKLPEQKRSRALEDHLERLGRRQLQAAIQKLQKKAEMTVS